MPLELVTAPTEEPVNNAEAREYLRIDDPYTDENLLRRFIVAARQQTEQFTNRALITQTWDWKLDDWWHGNLLIPKAPLQSVTSISYLDSAGDSQTWASRNYVVDTPDGDAAVKGRIGLATGVTFPVLENVISPVTIRFVAGYGLKATVPDNVKFGLLMLVADLYENRQSVVTGTISGLMPQTAQTLLWPYRVLEIA